MRKVVVGIIIVSLMGCSMGHRDPVEIKQELNEAANNANNRSLDELPASVQADLMPELDNNTGIAFTSLKRFRVQADGVEAKTFFASIINDTEYSAVIHPNVSGRMTVNLSDVTLDEVLNVARDMYGYDIIKTGKIIQVYPAGMRTETLPVDYLQLKRNGRSLTSITTSTVSTEDDDDNSDSDSNSNSSNSNRSSNSNSSSSSNTGGTTIETTSESDFWSQLQSTVESLIGSEDGRSVTVNPQAGVLTVRAQPSEIRDIKQFLSISHERLQRQVILEAKILEVTLSDGYQQGINWSNIGASIGSGSVDIARTAVSTILPGQDTIGELLGGQTNVTISDGNFEAVLSFMSTQGDLNVLSSPRVTAANNQKAVIKVGVDEYFVTGVTIDYIEVGDTSTPTTEYELTPFFSGISLDVTPQIDGKGNVMLHVHPAVIDVEEKTYEFLNDAPMARSSIRESDSIIRARDGDVVVIGGLMKSNTFDRVSKVPLLGDIPGLGHLFRNTSEYTEKTELVILLKPTVVGVHTWQQEVERSRDLLQEWFPDSE
ncbi:pilus (MSHA type) biogenesis protein MshL [Vibrio sp. DW001]|uniref:pilus (MSHA type) biogenesis protein MshL n=1 Tax=Vibrio sp. DW001 TaxID=2912315 RepID=UPI0023AED9A8|nr:pilus (MSHA type) biogenesis protein MshL [Vibrio sp. DW001]WED26400.1 pilus (MSHA type) biogenesis protein MshL [Vibrio sp. DW001]